MASVQLGPHTKVHFHKGALHRALGVPEGQKIPAKKMAQAEHSTNAHMQHMVALAHALRHVRP